MTWVVVAGAAGCTWVVIWVLQVVLDRRRGLTDGTVPGSVRRAIVATGEMPRWQVLFLTVVSGGLGVRQRLRAGSFLDGFFDAFFTLSKVVFSAIVVAGAVMRRRS